MRRNTMSKSPNPEDLLTLRKRHGSITYRSYTLETIREGLRIEFTFELENGPIFTPHMILPCEKPIIDRAVEALAFRIGLVELLSYWKVSCPERILIAAGYLPHSETGFWYDLLRKGLGEFFFINNISPHISVKLECLATPDERHSPCSPTMPEGNPVPDSYMILVGGGKDSIVSLELLRSLGQDGTSSCRAFSINPIHASLQAIAQAGYRSPLLGSRTIDPKLLRLNTNGYLNGHTPYSALLAFSSVLTAYLNSIQTVIASNESSASEGNVLFHDVEINHQYSKSIEFERAFRHVITTLQIPTTYCSLLRPLNELQICRVFSGHREHLQIFRSCNRSQTIAAKEAAQITHGITTTTWCGRCPKCIFTFLCLSCFLDTEDLTSIFGILPSDHEEFVGMVRELSGMESHKPFECVGTYNEVRACLRHLVAHKPELLKLAHKPMIELTARLPKSPTLSHLLLQWNQDNCLSLELETLVQRALRDNQW